MHLLRIGYSLNVAGEPEDIYKLVEVLSRCQFVDKRWLPDTSQHEPLDVLVLPKEQSLNIEIACCTPVLDADTFKAEQTARDEQRVIDEDALSKENAA